MAAINSATYNAGSTGAAGVYAPGDSIVLTVNFTPDSPSVVATPFTVTETVSDSTGTVVATGSSAFAINTPQPAGDVATVADSGSHTWVAGDVRPLPDGSISATFTTTA